MQSTINTDKEFYSWDKDNVYCGIVHGYTDPRRPSNISPPGSSTVTPPPDCGDGEIAIWRGVQWEKIPDLRGKVYYDTKTKECHEIKQAGEIPANTWTEIEPGDSEAEWDGEKWEIPFDVLKERKVKIIRSAADSALQQIQSGYSQSEIISWTKQEAGARELVKDAAALTPDAEFVRAMAKSREMPVTFLVEKIMKNLTPYAETMASVLGEQQRREDKVKTAKTPEELDAI